MSLDLHASARQAGSARWLDARLFEILGGWVASVPEPQVKVAFASQSHHHGWHAGLWGERLPTLHDVDPATWVAPAPGLEEVMDFLAGATDTIDRLVGVSRVLLPRMSAAHTRHLQVASPVSDGPTLRTLRQVLRDETEDQQTGQRLLDGLLVSPTEQVRAGLFQTVSEFRLKDIGVFREIV